MQPELLSEKANRIASDFRGRCRQSAQQGVHFCDTQSVVEDHAARVTPIEDAYLFSDKGEAEAVSTYLQSTLGRDRFNRLEVGVEPVVRQDGLYHIRIRAAWQPRRTWEEGE